MLGNVGVLIAAATFVGSHFLLSHPWRKRLVAALGQGAFLGLYSLVAFATLIWLILAFRAAPGGAPLWPAGNGLWGAVTLLMLLASVLLVGSMVRNPAFPSTGATALPRDARGVYAITRHPMLWAFALWGFCHILIFPVAPNIIVAVAIMVLALAGAAAQDAKKERLQSTGWRAWEAKTSYWPFVAMARGRARIGNIGWHAGLGGILVWLAATWAHIPLSGWPAGIWRWLR